MKKKMTRNQFLLTALYELMDKQGYKTIDDPIEGTCFSTKDDTFDIIYIEKPVISSPEIGDYSLTIMLSEDSVYSKELRTFSAEELETEDLEFIISLAYADLVDPYTKISYGIWLLDLMEKYKSLL